MSNNPDKPLSAGKKKKGGKTIEETYTKKTQLEHILLRPDTYVGSVEKQVQPMWVLEPTTGNIVQRPCNYVPGLYKIFDEIIVNAADNKQRDPTMNRIDVYINPSENMIKVGNNGTGIPIVIHQEHNCYVPELIFGHLLTGSNFDDNEEKTTGGRNGYGAKLANIFSTKFIIETSDKSRKLKYKQVFTNNMRDKTTPDVTACNNTDDYTSITFYPDLSKFKMDCLDADIVALLSKRVYDIAATNLSTGPKLNVYLNNKKIETKTFEAYINIYQGLGEAIGFERVNDRWEIGVGISDGTFQQVSYVNSICTVKGGQHVNYIADQIANRLVQTVKKKNKGQEVKAANIKNHLSIYINALITNPAFDSQTKENLTTKSSNFGSTCQVSEKLLKSIEKSNIIDNILSWAKFKQNAELKRKGGSKRSKLLGITKLDDANNAGTAKSKDCTLILTEGDSAKALAISGLGVVGRDYYGVFPLKGKLLNVREASHQQIMKNEEIQNIAKILGLTFGKDYADTNSLRYGHLMIMTDQDHDGSHIKGLLINFLHHFWPSLLKIEGFLQQFITPIVKCTKGNKEKSFYTIPEYTKWKEEHNDGKGYKIKYYKGLGTSTSAEAKEYFSHLSTHQIEFFFDDTANDVIEMAFSKKRVEDRKLWLLGLEPGVHIDYKQASGGVTYNQFINQELILFSHADNERSIPHFMDGMKPSQRKVLFSCFKRNLKNEIKVAQLAGYISEHSAYHHGEMSLTQTIIGMAQNFVGSNNINLLSPCGQFGTRLMGGKDAASPRYVFTKLEPITRCIFHPDDDALLEYLDDDGQSIEPTFYCPIIPMVLVNGSDGIGTGWSTSVPTYNPREIITNIRLILKGQQPMVMKPWYRGFIGDVDAKNTTTYSIAGVMEQVDDSTILIKELPVAKWTNDYKQFLETMVIGNTPAAATSKKDDDKDGNSNAAPAPAIIKDFKENHTDTTVLFTISMPPEKLQECIQGKDGIYRKFKLETTVSTTNMHLFDLNSTIHKYDSATDILYAFYDVRISFYEKRKNYLLSKLTEEWEQLDNKVRFILDVISGKLVVSNRKKQDLFNDLKKLGFKQFIMSHSMKNKNPISAAAVVQEDDDDDDNRSVNSLDSTAPLTISDEKGYDYLLSMKIWSLTQERVQALTAQRDEKNMELKRLMVKSPSDLWLEDLDNLEDALKEYEGEIIEANRLENIARTKATNDRNNKAAGKKRVMNKYDDSDLDDDDDDDFDEDDDYGKKAKKAKAAKASKNAGNSGSSANAVALKGQLIPRKIIIEKEKTEKIPSSTAATATAGTSGTGTGSATKEKKVKVSHVSVGGGAKSKKSSYDIPTDSDDDSSAQPRAKLSLAERLALKKSNSPNPGGGSGTSSSITSYFSKSTTATAAAKPKKTTTSAMIDLASHDEDDDDDDDFDNHKPVTPSGLSRVPRAAAVAAATKAYSIDDSDDEDAEFDEDDEDVKPKNKKPVAATKATTTAAPKRKKTKANDSDDDDDDDDSDVEIIKPVKKTKAATASVKPKPSTASVKPKSSAPKPAAKAVPKKKSKKSYDSDDDDGDDMSVSDHDDDDDDVEFVNTIAATKPKRARQPLKYNYDEDDDDDDDEEFDEDDEDD